MRTLPFMLALLALLALPATAKVPEVDAAPKTPLSGAALAKAATVVGSVGPQTYDRIFTGAVDNNCNAPSTFSGSGVGVPYAVIPFHTRSFTGEPLVASINTTGTDIGDTVLSVYCQFNPADASTGLVAYDDDGGSGLLSAFDGSEGAVIQPGRTYVMVVSTFSPGAVGGGNFSLSLGGQLAQGSTNAAQLIPVDGPLAMWGLGLGVLLVGVTVLMRRRGA